MPKKPAPAPPAARSARWPWGVAAALLASVVAFWALRGAPPRAPEEPAPVPRVTLRPTPARPGAPGDLASPEGSAALYDPSKAVPLGPPDIAAPPGADDEPHRRWLATMLKTREAFLEKNKYPPASRPLAMKTDLLLPNHVEPTFRRLKEPGPGGDAGKVSLKLGQDRGFLKPGDAVTLTLEASIEGKPVAIDAVQAKLLRLEGPDGKPSAPLMPITFADDGAPPDQAAGDLVYTARVRPTADQIAGYSGRMVVTAEVQVGPEVGHPFYQVVMSAPPPARFTGAIREAVEQGSLAFYVGVEVTAAGYFEIYGRLYDANERPIALMTFNNGLTAGQTEVRLFAFGKVIHDEGGASPFLLRDLEGWRLLSGVFPDREVMDVLDPRYRSRSYPPATFSDAEYTSPEKAKSLARIDEQIKQGPSSPSAALPPPGAPPIPPPPPSQ